MRQRDVRGKGTCARCCQRMCVERTCVQGGVTWREVKNTRMLADAHRFAVTEWRSAPTGKLDPVHISPRSRSFFSPHAGGEKRRVTSCSA